MAFLRPIFVDVDLLQPIDDINTLGITSFEPNGSAWIAERIRPRLYEDQLAFSSEGSTCLYHFMELPEGHVYLIDVRPSYSFRNRNVDPWTRRRFRQALALRLPDGQWKALSKWPRTVRRRVHELSLLSQLV